MQKLNAPPSEHDRFDELTQRLGEWEPLTAISATPPDADLVREGEVEHSGPMNDLILAGLVSPY